jgi:hypothetical protein
MFGRYDGDLARADLGRVFPDANVDSAVKHLKPHAPSLVVLVEDRACAKHHQDQSEGSGFG